VFDRGSFPSIYLSGKVFKDRHLLNLSVLKCISSSYIDTYWINLGINRTLSSKNGDWQTNWNEKYVSFDKRLHKI